MRLIHKAPRVGVLVAAIASCFAANVQANPSGPTVANGQVSILRNANLLQITNSPSSIINWQSFSIGAGEITRFIQQSSASAVLNRVTSQNPSAILGSLQSNGRVFLLNPSGIVFGPGSQVNVGGLVASSLNLSDADFLGGRLNFTQTPGAGAIVNQGTINTAQGGSVYLVGPAVTNSGIITSPNGEVVLAAGNSVQLVDPGTPNLRVEITAPDNQATNLGQIVADSGRVGIYAGLIDHSGTVRANSVDVTAEGRIVLKATKSVTLEAGSVLSATGSNGANGGFIETSAAKVIVDPGAVVTTAASQGKTGIWLIDPNDYTIAASGGDITGTQLSANLGTNSVTIVSSDGGTAGGGDINVNDAVSWSANTLTLTAARDININAVMTPSGTSGLALNPGTLNGVDSAVTGGMVKAGLNTDGTFKGIVDFGARSGTGFLTINGNAYTVINSLGAAGSVTGTDLQGMSGNPGGFYALGSDIDASATTLWNAGAGFAPVGDSTTAFTGVFDGLGHTIAVLNISSPTSNAGLFGYITGAAIRNVGLAGASVSGSAYVGGLVGNASTGGSVIANSYSTGGDVTGNGSGWYVGGLVGAISTTGGIAITNSYSTGNVTSPGYYVGGLAGFTQGTVTNSYSTSGVTGNGSGWYVGGLVGINTNSGTITNSYSTGAVRNSGNYTGGLVGGNSNTSTITNSYSTGSVSGSWFVGGLAGQNDASSTISNSYSAGAVTGSGAVGGLAGANGGTITNSYWDTITSGQAASAGGTGLTTSQMRMQASFSGWDFANTWTINEGVSYPTLRVFAPPPAPLAFIWDNGDGNSLWTDPLNWNFNSGLPGSLDSVTINLAGGGQVLLTTGSHSIASIVSTANNNLVLNGGSLTVSGTANLAGNTTLQSGSSLTLLGASTLANYTQSGGTLSNAAATSIAAMNWTGGTITGAGVLTVTGALDMPAGASSNAWNRTYLDGTTLNANGATTFGSGQNFGGNGAELNLLNGAAVNNGGTWTISYANILGTAATPFNNTGTFNTGTAYGGTITSALNNSGTLNVNAVGDGLTLTGSGVSSGIFNVVSGATLAFASGSAQTLSGALSGAGSIDNSSTLTLSGATVATGATLTNNGALVVPSGANVINGTVSGGGTLSVTGGSVEIDGTASVGSNLINAGTILGTGTLTVSGGDGTLFNNGHVTPGTSSSTGTLTVSGNVTFGASSSLDVRIAGTNQFDKLAVTGPVSLNGALTATLANGFTPSGESFPVLTYGNGTGLFSALNLPTNFQGTYNALDFTLTHTPVAGSEFWTNASALHDSLWTNKDNWSLGRVPNGTDDVTLNLGTATTVHVSSGTNSAGTLASTANNSLLIDGGSLTVSGAATMNGNVTVQSGTLNVNGAYTGATTDVSGGTATFNGRYSSTSTNVSGGTANFNFADPAGVTSNALGTLNFSGGVIGSTNTSLTTPPSALELGGNSSWTGGNFVGGTGMGLTLTVPAGVTLEKSGSATVSLSDTAIVNNGALKLSGGQITLQIEPTSNVGPAIFNNNDFNIAADATVSGNAVSGFGPSVLVNNTGALVEKTAGTGTGTIALKVMDKGGHWRVDSGTLSMISPAGFNSTGTGTMHVDAGAGTLAFGGGGFDMAAFSALPASTVGFTGATVSFSGAYSADATNVSAGTANFDGITSGVTTNVSGGTANFNYVDTSGSTYNMLGTLNLSGGVIGSTNTSLLQPNTELHLAGNSTWTGGSFVGGTGLGQMLVIPSGASLEKSGSATVSMSDTAISNSGTLKLSGGQITLSVLPTSNWGAAIYNNNTLTISADANLTASNPGGNGSVLYNKAGALVEKTGGSGSASISTLIRDLGGTWRVDSGTLSLNSTALSNSDGTGTMHVNAGAGVLAFSSGTFNMSGLTAQTGSTVSFDGANASFSGAYASDTTKISGGTLSLNGTGTAATISSLTISGGTLDGSRDRTVSSAFSHTAGAFSTTGAASLTQMSGNLTLTQPVSAATVQINVPTGSLSETGSGAISASSLTTSSVGGQSLSGTNAVGTFNASNTSSGNITFNNGAGLSVAGIGQSGGGNVSVTSAGKMTLSGAVNAGAGDVSLTTSAGDILGGSGTVTGGNVTLNAAGGISGVNTSSTGTLHLATHGSGSAGNISVTEANALNTNRVALLTDASGHSVSLTAKSITTGVNNVGDIGKASDSLTLIASGGNIDGGGATVNGANVSLQASGGIGTTLGLRVRTAGTLSLTTAGTGSAGNISVAMVDPVYNTSGPLDTNKVVLNTDASAQTVTLSGSTIKIGGSICSNGFCSSSSGNLGNSTDDLALAGYGIAGGWGTLTAKNLTLYGNIYPGSDPKSTVCWWGSCSTSISYVTNPVRTATTGNLTLGSSGSSIAVQEANALNTNRVVLTSTAPLDLSAPSITVGGNLSNPSLTLHATGGDIVGGAGTLSATNLTLSASGGIGIGTPVKTDATGTLSLTSAGSGSAGNISIVAASALDAAAVAVSTDASAQTISLAAPSISVDGNIGNATDSLVLKTTAGDIGGGAGTATANNLTLDASGGIGIGTGLNTNTSGTLSLTTHGAGSAGTISVTEANALNTNRVVISTDSSAQTMSLSAPSITVQGNIGNASDDLVLKATTGDIAGGIGLATAANLTLDAAGGIVVGSSTTSASANNATSSPPPVRSSTTGMLRLTTHGVGTGGNIDVVESNALNTNRVALSTDASAQSVSLSAPTITLGQDIGNLTDDLALTATTHEIRAGAGTAIANNLTLNAESIFGDVSGPVLTPLYTRTGGILSLTTWGLGAGPGDINVKELSPILDWAGRPVLTTDRVRITTARGAAHNVRLAADNIILSGWLGQSGTSFGSQAGQDDYELSTTLVQSPSPNSQVVGGGYIGGGSGGVWSRNLTMTSYSFGGDIQTSTSGLISLTAYAPVSNISIVEKNALATNRVALSGAGNIGMVALSAPSIQVNNDFAPQSQLRLAGNTTISTKTLSGTQSLTNAAGSTLALAPNGTLTSARPIINDGSANIAAGSTLKTASLQNNGTLSGTGAIDVTGGALTNDGAIDPGSAGSAGTLTVLGDVNFHATGSLNIERFSNTSIDRLAVSGKAALGGTLAWTDRYSSLVSDGTAYTVLTYGSKVGTFASMSIPAKYSASYLADRLDIVSPNLFTAASNVATGQVVSSLSTVSQLINLVGAASSSGSMAATTSNGAVTKPAPSCSSPKALKSGACTP